MKLGEFKNKGENFIINTKNTPTKWNNILFNDNYYMELSQTMQGKSYMVSQYNPKCYIENNRHFYILNRDTKDVFCPTGAPLNIELDEFSYDYGLYYSKVTSKYKGVTASVRAFVPAYGDNEIWTISITNNTDKETEFSVFSSYVFENSGPMCGECKKIDNQDIVYKYSFPYHVRYEEKEQVENKKAYYYMMSDCKINSYDGSGQRFYGGCDVTSIPIAIKNGECSNIPSQGEDFTGTIENRFILKPNETKEINIILGAVSKKEELINRNFLDVSGEFLNVKKLWEERNSSFKISTPEKELDYLANYWLKKQAIFLTRLNRTSTYCPVRNQLQDALGYSIIDPYEALEYALKVLRRQHKNGYLKQWYMTDGSPDKALCLIDHSDAPLWLIICIVEIIEKCGDATLYEKLESYMDCDECESILTHLKKAAYYMASQVGSHNLCLMLDGDWTDPINGAGRLGKGESTWNSMALLYCVKKLNEISPDEKLLEIEKTMDLAINNYCWDGEYYVTGFDDNGIPFGTSKDKEAKIFLNAQTWGIISGAATGERLEKLKKSIETLKTPFGYLLLKPAFEGWNDTWGRISIKQPGTTENGSVYCHASMFKALSDTCLGDGESAINVILDTLPTNVKNKNNLQLPLFVPNYYFGLENENFGRSSCHYGTGTTGWLLWVLVEHILGVKATKDGVRLEPCIPKKWDGFSITRKFKNAVYNIVVENLGQSKEIFVDGVKLNSHILPYEDNKVYNINVKI